MSNESEKEITNLELLESINRGFSKIEEKMATKVDLESFKLEANTHFNKIEFELSETKSEVKSFKVETRERFDKIEEKLEEVNENVEAIIKDYHPRIEALEEKVLT